jgi:hypothetical protein
VNDVLPASAFTAQLFEEQLVVAAPARFDGVLIGTELSELTARPDANHRAGHSLRQVFGNAQVVAE